MKSLTKILTVFYHLCLMVTLASSNVPEYIRMAPGAKEYPDADALLLKQEITLTLLPDGRVERHYFSATKLLTEYYIGRHSDPLIKFNTATQTLKIIQSRTYMRDGRAVDTQKNGLNEITPFALDAAPDYTNIRQMIVTHVGVEHFCTNVLEYQLNDQKEPHMPFWGELSLQSDIPILEQKIVIKVPLGTKLHIAAVNIDLEPEKTLEDDYVIYTVERKNIPGVNIAENRAHQGDFIHRLVFSTADDWKHARLLLSKNLMSVFNVDETLREKIRSIASTALNRLELMDRIHEFVVDKINTVDWPVDDFDFQARTASQIYYSGYGHCLDKAVLLTAMLKELGIDHHLEFASSTRYWHPDVPSLTQFDQFWVVAEVDGESYWLNPVATLEKQSVLDIVGPVLSVDAASSTGPTQLEPAVRMHRCWITGELQLFVSPAGLNVAGSLNLELTGRYSPFTRPTANKTSQENLSEKIVENFFHARTQSITLPGLTKTGSTVKIHLVDGKIAGKEGIPFVVTLPLPIQSLTTHSDGFNTGRSQTSVPIFIPAPMEEYLFLTLRLPEGVRVTHTPEMVRLENKVGMALITTRIVANEIQFEEILRVRKEKITPELYPEFRQLLLALLTEANRTILMVMK